MKQIVLLIALSVMGMLVNAQYITNNGFENWTASDPDDWHSPDSLTSPFGVTTVSKETVDVYSGLNSAKLETKSVLGTPIPGILTNGTITINPPYLIGGTPFTQKPGVFKGYYKYTPATGDNCFLDVLLLKWNINTNQQDTIGYAQFTNLATVSTWTMFQANFTYNSIDNPDTMQIALISSNPNAAVTGSILLVDELSLEGGTLGLNKYYLLKNISIFPNPATNIINIKFSSETKYETAVSLYSLVGQKVKAFTLPKGIELSSLNINDISKGMYFILIQSGKEKIIQKISIIQ